MSETIYASITATVDITISDDAPDDIFTRGIDPEWFNSFYGEMTRDQVIEHWCHNAAANGVEDVCRLDGWANVDRGMVTFDVNDVSLDS